MRATAPAPGRNVPDGDRRTGVAEPALLLRALFLRRWRDLRSATGLKVLAVSLATFEELKGS